MATVSAIEWTDVTWNPTRGCRRVSPGCGGAAGEGGCYAERQAARFSGKNQPYEGLIEIGRQGPRWTGKGRLVPSVLAQPLSWRKPRRVFVDSMSDLFFEAFSDEEIAAVFGVMAAAPQHTFQVLTKRPDRMLRWFEWSKARAAEHAARTGRHWCWSEEMGSHALHYMRDEDDRLAERVSDQTIGIPLVFPLHNVWLGVSVEDQKRADERIPLLLQTPAALRFLSVEPLIERVDLSRWVFDRRAAIRAAMNGPAALNAEQADAVISYPIDWAIVGGESGPGARPCELGWIRSIVEQCRAAGTPCFAKQLGAHPVEYVPPSGAPDDGGDTRPLVLRDRKGGDITEFPADLRVREFPEVQP